MLDLPIYATVPFVCVAIILILIIYLGFKQIKSNKKAEAVIVEPLPRYEIQPPPYEYSAEPPVYVIVER